MKKTSSKRNNNNRLKMEKKNVSKTYNVFGMIFDFNKNNINNNDSISEKKETKLIKNIIHDAFDDKTKPFDPEEKILTKKEEEAKRIEDVKKLDLFFRIKNVLKSEDIYLKNGDETIKIMENLIKHKLILKNDK